MNKQNAFKGKTNEVSGAESSSYRPLLVPNKNNQRPLLKCSVCAFNKTFFNCLVSTLLSAFIKHNLTSLLYVTKTIVDMLQYQTFQGELYARLHLRL